MDLRRQDTVDVVIPVRNRARFIPACLDSVRAQTWQPNSVIVVDDGSTDETPVILAEYARRWPALHVIRSAPRGASHARNLGIRASHSAFIAFLDSDDIWFPDKLERQMALFAQEQVGFVHCACMQIDEFGDPLSGGVTFAPSKRGDVFEAMINEFYHIAGSASAVVARRDLVRDAGGFDETLLYAEDQDYWLKLASRSRVDYVPGVLVAIRTHKGNRHDMALRDDPELVLLQRLKIWNKWNDQLCDVALDYLRDAAVWANAGAALKPRWLRRIRFYFRLRQTNMALAQRLFPNLWSFLRYRAS